MSTQADELRGAMARAMKERAARPLGNIPTLEPVLVGCLGDAWNPLVEAALTALYTKFGEMGLRIVPEKLTPEMSAAFRESRSDMAGVDFGIGGLDGASIEWEWSADSIAWEAFTSAAPKLPGAA